MSKKITPFHIFDVMGEIIGTEYIERYLYARFDVMKACHVSL